MVTMMAKPIRALELYYPMIQFLTVIFINKDCSNKSEIDYILLKVMQNKNINAHIHCIYLLSLCMFLDLAIQLNFYL